MSGRILNTKYDKAAVKRKASQWRWQAKDDRKCQMSDMGDFLSSRAYCTRLISFYVCGSMRSSLVKSTPENGLLFICLSSWAFSSRTYRIFNASFTLKYPHHK